jgi:hypothetical protein
MRYPTSDQGASALGWVEGRNLLIDYRWSAAGDNERFARDAAELYYTSLQIV